MLCPGRLVQFLRMYTKMDEGDYNELYHLSNCKCRKENPWLYVVGDRVFSPGNYRVELFDVMCYSEKHNKAYLLHVKKDFEAQSFRAVCSQVRVSGDQVWKSLTLDSPENMFVRFYDVASNLTEASEESIHKTLTKIEVSSIGNFEEAMKSHKLKFYICLAPCLSLERNLSKLKKANLNYSFASKDFKGNPISDLVEKKFLSRGRNIMTGKMFTTQKSFVEMLTSEDCLKSEAKEIYDTIAKKICGGGKKSRLMGGSFPAKIALIDLGRVFSDYYTHGGTRVSLKILEIKRLQDIPPQNLPGPKQMSIEQYFKKSASQISVEIKADGSRPDVKQNVASQPEHRTNQNTQQGPPSTKRRKACNSKSSLEDIKK